MSNEMVEYDNTETSLGNNQMPPSLTEEHLKFLDGIDEVPIILSKPLWGLFTRHNALTNIPNEIEMNRTRTLVRCCTRVMGWEGTINLVDTVQVQRFVELQIQKSRNQGERRLLTPWLQEITRKESTIESSSKQGGVFSRAAGAIFGRR